jgi:hypothetical protein
VETLWLLERKEGKERAMDDATFLYPAKAAAGPCVRLARCGGRGFLIRACRLVIYLILLLYFLFSIILIKLFILLANIL